MMKKYPKTAALLRLVIFSLIFLSLFLCIDAVFRRNRESNPTWEYAADSSQPIDILFAGNSHIYTSIDSGVLSSASGLNIRSLACSSANGEIIAADLEAFLKYQRPEVIVLDTCPFAAENFDDMRQNKLGIILEHFDGIPDIRERFSAVSGFTSFEDTPAGVFGLLRASDMWERWESQDNESPEFDEYGASRKYAVYDRFAFDPDAVRAQYLDYAESGSANIHEINASSIDRILALSDEYGFDIWVYNAPTGRFDERFAGVMKYFDELRAENPKIKYIDNSMLSIEEIGLTCTDFFDSTHVNSRGMEKVSMWYLDLIAERFGVTPDLSGLVCYAGEDVTLLGPDLYRYRIYSYADALYRFVYTDAHGAEIDTGYTPQNWVDDTLLRPALITVYMIPSGSDAETAVPYVCHFLNYAMDNCTYSSDGGTLTLCNRSSFSDSLYFGWQIEKRTTGEVVLPCEFSRTDSTAYTFSESGSYYVYALVKQQPDAEPARRTLLFEAVYDSETDTLSLCGISSHASKIS